MPVHDGPWPDGTPCWVDVTASDLGTARLFYEGLFGWSMEVGPPETGGYINCSKNDRLAAGISPKMRPDEPSAWTVYFSTTDLEGRSQRVADNGGQVLMGPMDVLDIGAMSVCTDPAGASFGLWRPGSHLGVGVVNEPSSLIWTEQLSHSPEACITFYRTVFDWEMHDWSFGGPPYSSFVSDGRDIGGVGGYRDGEELADQWWVSLAVDDTDEAVDRVVKLGGSVILPPSDSPYGRRASVADPEGARFALLAAPPEGYGD